MIDVGSRLGSRTQQQSDAFACAACVYDVLTVAAESGVLGLGARIYDAQRYRGRAERIRAGRIKLPSY